MTDEKEPGLNLTQQHDVQAAIDAALAPVLKQLDAADVRLDELKDVSIDRVAALLERFPPTDGEAEEAEEPEPAETRAERQDRLADRDEEELEEAEYGGREARQDEIAERAAEELEE